MQIDAAATTAAHAVAGFVLDVADLFIDQSVEDVATHVAHLMSLVTGEGSHLRLVHAASAQHPAQGVLAIKPVSSRLGLFGIQQITQVHLISFLLL